MLSTERADQILAASDCIYTEEQVHVAVDTMAQSIEPDYRGRYPLILSVMNGGLFLTAALLSRLQFPLEFDYLHISRYRDSTVGGKLQWQVEPATVLTDRHVLIVDDILDEGVTMAEIIRYCKAGKAASVEVAVLTRKRHDRVLAEVDAKYIGLELPDRYVFGCGMDYKGCFRNLNAVYALSDMIDD